MFKRKHEMQSLTCYILIHLAYVVRTSTRHPIDGIALGATFVVCIWRGECCFMGPGPAFFLDVTKVYIHDLPGPFLCVFNGSAIFFRGVLFLVPMTD